MAVYERAYRGYDGPQAQPWSRFAVISRYALRDVFRSRCLLVYGPVRSRAGMGRVRVAYTAGEAIGPEIFEFWRRMRMTTFSPLTVGITLKRMSNSCPCQLNLIFPSCGRRSGAGWAGA